MSEQNTGKPTKYYVDFENVHGPGLKGIEDLSPDDHVLIFYSQAAETLHIEHAIGLMKSQARIEFVEIDAGTRNALDFQLVTALYGAIDPAYSYAIVTGDGGFDAAIKMGERMGLADVVRIANIQGDAEAPKTKSRSQRQRRNRQSKVNASQPEPDPNAPIANGPDPQAAAEPLSPPSQPAPDAQEARESASPGPELALEADADSLPFPANQAEETVEPDAQEHADGHGETEGHQAPAEKPSSRRRSSRGSGKSGKREAVAAHLEGEGVVLTQQQLSTVMQALSGVKNKQMFYRRIIQLEKQEKGLELYHLVRSHYDSLAEIEQGA